MKRIRLFASLLIVTLTTAPTRAQDPSPGSATEQSPFGSTSQDFGGIRTFLRAPYLSSLDGAEVDIAVVGVPVDGGTSNRPGARYGPRDIREASLIYAWARESGFYYIDTGKTALEGVRWADLGDVDVRPSVPAETSERITRAVRQVLAHGAFPVVLGGDHSISFPVLRAFDEPSILLVHFDAHLDNYGNGNPEILDHGAWVKQVAHNLPNVTKIVQIGMRGLAAEATGVARTASYSGILITSEQIHAGGVEAALAQIPSADAIYVSLDIDVLDPSLAPGTGTVEVGGLTFHQLQALLTGLTSRGRLVGFDVVEVNSFFDPTGVTAQTAARLAIDLLAAGYRPREAGEAGAKATTPAEVVQRP